MALLTVRVLTLDDDGADVEEGKIHYDTERERFSLDPSNNETLVAVLNTQGPRLEAKRFRPLTFETDPILFLNELHRMYKSAYLRVTKPGE